MRWFGWLRRPALMVKPGVHVVEENVTIRPIPTMPNTAVLIGQCVDGPVDPPVLLSPAMAEPRWWQFWKRRAWRRECEAARERQRAFFGPLVVADPPSPELIEKYLMADASPNEQHGAPDWIGKAVKPKEPEEAEKPCTHAGRVYSANRWVCGSCGATGVDGE